MTDREFAQFLLNQTTAYADPNLLQTLQDRLVRGVLELCGDKQTVAALVLGVSTRKLNYLLEHLGERPVDIRRRLRREGTEAPDAP